MKVGRDMEKVGILLYFLIRFFNTKLGEVKVGWWVFEVK